MNIRSKIFLSGDIKKMGEMPPGTLCPKISFLDQKLRAVAREQTHTHRERKQNLETPFFCNLFFASIALRITIKSTC